MSYLTDRKRVQGLGSTNDGTHHFVTQRVTAVALMPLAILFIIPFAKGLGADHADVLSIYSNPFNAIVAILFFFTAFTHLRMGLQVVIEDYVHGKTMLVILLVANTLLCWLFSLTGIFAVAKIAL